MQAQVPFAAWVVMPSLAVKQIELVVDGGTWWGRGVPMYKTAQGKTYPADLLHATKDDAIAAAKADLDRIAADLEKRKANYDKKRAVVDKLLKELV